MTNEELIALLTELRQMPAESEWVEFKEAKTSYDFDKMGKYFSALSNKANLKGKSSGWLVFGIEDTSRKIVGSNYRPSRASLDSLKAEIANKTSGITFTEIYELSFPEGRVIMFQIPPAPKGLPTAWDGHYYGRHSESLGALSIQEFEQIRQQVKNEDWSAHICSEASINDLDPAAIQKARLEYKNKYSNLAADVDQWDDITFLNKAKVLISGRVTRTAILLLGRAEASHYLSPSEALISWILKDENNIEKDYEHFGPPFLLNADRVLAHIRNLKYRYLPEKTLFPIEVTQYDSYVIREALHNCIAHQDYEMN